MKRDFKFDFDYWSSLYQNAPEDFERERESSVNNFIENANSSVKRLRGIQFRIDLERQRHNSPMGSCLKLYQLMLDKFHEEFVPRFGKFKD